MRSSLVDPNDASLRVSKATRDRLKMASAVLGRPFYEVTHEALEEYLMGLRLPVHRCDAQRPRARK
jgi:hypothetical protein